MKWANFLHFYQPASQQKDIIEAVVNQCYRPIFKGLLALDNAKLTINVSGGLFEILAKYGFLDVLNDLKLLYGSGRVEFTSTACYHAFLPLLPVDEIKRQIVLNNDILRKYLGQDFTPRGFFSPEMAYNKKVFDVVCTLGFDYMLLDEISCRDGQELLDTKHLYKIDEPSLTVFFRQRNPSNIIMSGLERKSGRLHEMLRKYSTGEYLITAMDGETFGHHRPGLEKSFLEMFKNNDVHFCKIADLLTSGLPSTKVDLVDSTWASSPDDISKGIQFISWKDPANTLHKWQWEYVELMLHLVAAMAKDHSSFQSVRDMADRALASDQFFWASAKPWWSVEMIESGAYGCLATIEQIPHVSEAQLKRARSLYRSIISTAFDWQRTGKIREMSKDRFNIQRIPFKVRTLEAGGEEEAVFQAFIDMMRSEERKAADMGDYERAILWRDAVYKLETKNDIYDAVNAVDLLRIELSNERVEKMISDYKARYLRLRGGQPEQRSN